MHARNCYPCLRIQETKPFQSKGLKKKFKLISKITTDFYGFQTVRLHAKLELCTITHRWGTDKKNWGFFATTTWPLKSIYSLEIGQGVAAGKYTHRVVHEFAKACIEKEFFANLLVRIITGD